MDTNLGRVLSQRLKASGTKNKEYYQESGVEQTVVWRIIHKGNRPTEDTLKKLCHSWPTEEENLNLLIAHLQDEAEKAGRGGEIEFKVRGKRATKLDKSLAILRDACVNNKELAGVLNGLAGMVLEDG